MNKISLKRPDLNYNFFQNLSSHYRLAGADYNHYVQIGWDVAAFLTFIVISIIYLLLVLIVSIVQCGLGSVQMKYNKIE